MTLRARKLRIVLTLMILWAISTSVCTGTATAQTAQPDSVLVPVQVLRDATRKIDQQDLRIMLLENRVAERDSLLSSRDVEWEARLAHWQEYAEKVKASTWDLIWPALLVLLGVAAGRL